MITIEIHNPQLLLPVDEDRLRRAVRLVLTDAGLAEANISIAVIDDLQMRRLNHRYLDHDYATDVLSFVLEHGADGLDGEIIVSAETAVAAARAFDWTAEDELLLYVLHGALHLVGYDDTNPAAQAGMREREQHYLAAFGLQARYEQSSNSPPPPRAIAEGQLRSGCEAAW